MNKNEKMLTVKISEELHRAIKTKSAERGLKLKEYITQILEEELKKDTKEGR